MEVKVTAKIKIPKTPEIIQTLKAYSKALQFCVDNAWSNKIQNNVKLHPIVYSHLRKNFGLQSQLAVACIKQSCGMVKKARSKPNINKISMRYNFPRSASFKDDTLSISTINGRQKFRISIPKCYLEYFKSWKVCESLLRIDKKDRYFFLFAFSKNISIKDFNNKTLGIDLGINNIAVTSNREFFNSSKIKQIKRKFRYLRSKLQAKGTRSTRELLKKISGREKRFMVWVNHNVSKKIVSNFDGSKIVMENLKGIRKKKKGKKINYWLNNWSFHQLQSFITYKAAKRGIVIEKINAIYSSQICSKCHAMGKRLKGFFHCNCGLTLNSDLNASRNLAKGMSYLRQGVVNHPHISNDDTKADSTELRLSLGIKTLKLKRPVSIEV